MHIKGVFLVFYTVAFFQVKKHAHRKGKAVLLCSTVSSFLLGSKGWALAACRWIRVQHCEGELPLQQGLAADVSARELLSGVL